jgi:hypothetical protein
MDLCERNLVPLPTSTTASFLECVVVKLTDFCLGPVLMSPGREDQSTDTVSFS